MRYSNIFLVLALVISSLTSLTSADARAADGGMTSSGAEFVTTEGNPWFVGTAPVEYCIQKSEDFSPTLEVARHAVTEVISD
ncbi:hypothetical protein WDW86_03330 [Bdellovibrionota bacterium FG-2]